MRCSPQRSYEWFYPTGVLDYLLVLIGSPDADVDEAKALSLYEPQGFEPRFLVGAEFAAHCFEFGEEQQVPTFVYGTDIGEAWCGARRAVSMVNEPGVDLQDTLDALLELFFRDLLVAELEVFLA